MAVMAAAVAGVKFVFGQNFEENLGFTVALNVLPVIVFVGALMAVQALLTGGRAAWLETPIWACFVAVILSSLVRPAEI